ncbi:hypothetical protein H7Y29_00985 [Microbacteriaceae bacterium]|nr:hypothetical protein [Candidatus Saccharibacteria bacterium]
MSIDELRRDAAIMTRWEQHRFLALIGGVILVALFLVSVALSLYNSSGAAQLDLSRPGYQDVRDLAKRDTTSKSFPASGVLDKEALDLFSKLYGEQSAKVISADSFDASAISEDSLQMLSEPRENP